MGCWGMLLFEGTNAGAFEGTKLDEVGLKGVELGTKDET